MSIKGWPDQDKSTDGRGEHVTISPVKTQQQALDVKAYSTVYAADTGTIAAGPTKKVIPTTFTQIIRKGDIIHFVNGLNVGHEATIFSVTGAVVTLCESIPELPTAGDSIRLLRFKSSEVTTLGSVSAGPVTYTRNGAPQVVTEDTATPANNRPLPVKLTGFDGDVSINAANLNMEVQLGHTGADYDSIRIGDGSDLLAVNADGSVSVSGNSDTKLQQGAGAVTAATLRTTSESGQHQTHIDNLAANTAINAKLPVLGQALMAASLPVAIASNQGALAVTAASLPLPAGASTGALQTAANASLSSIDTKLTSPLSVSVTSSVEVEVKNDSGSPIPVSAASLPLPAGASTEATLATINGKTPALGQAVMAASVPVVISSNQSALPVTVSQTYTTSDIINFSHSATNVTSAAYVQILFATTLAVKRLHIFDSSGEGLLLARGAAAAETNLLIIPPGGYGSFVDINIAAGQRLSIRSATGVTTTVGSLYITLLG